MNDDIYEPGEVYNITVTGARVISVAHNGWIRFAVPDGPVHEIAPYSDAFTVERADPEWWPLLPGDVLRHTGTGRLWFGVAHGSNLCLYSSNADCMDPQQSWEQRHQLTLVDREDEQDGGRSDG